MNFNKDFFRNIVILTSGAAGAQIITLLSAPFITRLYGPEAFGLLGTFIAVLSILIPIVSLTLPQAIVIAKTEVDSQSLSNASIVICVLSSLFISIIIGFISIYDYYNIEVLGNWLFLLPVALVTTVMYQIAEQKSIRNKDFKFIAKMGVAQSLIFNSFKLFFGLLWPSPFVLVAQQSFFGGIWSAGYKIFGKRYPGDALRLITFIKIKSILIKYKDFPLYRAPEIALSAASQGIPVLILSSMYSVESAGYFSLTIMLLSMPAALLGKAVGDTYYPKLAESKSIGTALYPLLKQATFMMAALGIIPFIILSIFGQLIFSTVFGDEWGRSGEYSAWLSIWMFSLFINLPSIKTMAVIEEQKILLYFTIITLVSRLGIAFLALIFEFDDLEMISIFGVVGGLINMILISLVFSRCKIHDGKLNG